jgi:hypothetical protein
MNNQSHATINYTSTIRFLDLRKSNGHNSSLKIRQMLLISRIMMSILTIGLLGYTFDRVLQTIQRSSISD